MPPTPDTTGPSAGERHRCAVANTLRLADDAADAGDYHDALAWLTTLEAIGEPVPAEYRAKQRAWAARAETATR